MIQEIKYSDTEQKIYFSDPLTGDAALVNEVISAIAKVIKQINKECVEEGRIIVRSDFVLTSIPFQVDLENKFRICIAATRLKQSFTPVLGGNEPQDWAKE